jgi:hypothetical protein
MMVFLGNRYINLDHVKTIAFCTRDKVHFADVEFADKTSASYKVGGDLSETVVSSTTVPAPPSYRLAMVDEGFGGEETTLLEEIIIAFRIPHSGHTPTPVTIQGEAGRSPSNKWAIIRPDGSVSDPYDQEYKDVTEFPNECKSRAR